MLLFLLLATAASGQGDIPSIYRQNYPYYTGNTALEIGRNFAVGYTYVTIQVDASELDTNGQTDVSVKLQAHLDAAAKMAMDDTIVTVLLPAGKFLLQHTLRLSSNVVLKGQGAQTELLIATGEYQHGILIAPKNSVIRFSLQLKRHAPRGTGEIIVDRKQLDLYKSLYGPLKYISLRRLDDEQLLTSPWAKGCITEHFYAGKTRDSGAYSVIGLAHPLLTLASLGFNMDISIGTRTTFLGDTSKSVVLVQEFIENAGVMCLAMQRLDSTGSQTSNIMLDQAYNCVVSDVHSVGTNFAHICINNSAFNLLKRCDLSSSFGYGGAGRAYGVVLQMGSSSNVVMDNYFSRLRHGMLLQAGANGNVLYANVSVNTYWDEFPQDASGDIVLHGNYVYANLCEMNSVQQIVIDNSHGRNGPYNLFFRNQLKGYGILMSAANGSDSQVFAGNEINSTETFKGLYMLNDKGHFESGNQVKGKQRSGDVNSAIPMFYWKPLCNKNVNGKLSPVCFPSVYAAPFGYPFNPSDDILPARTRKQTSVMTCGADYDPQFSVFSAIREDPDINHPFAVYPNPAHDRISIDAGFAGLLLMYDLQGKVFGRYTLTGSQESVQLPDLATGMYVLQYVSVTGNSASVKLLVQ